MSDYASALSALYRLEAFGMRLGLDNVAAYCAAAGHPERAWPAFHVAGTNGKGTTAACLAALARAHGLRTGLYTSPHLVDFRERIRIDGRAIPRAALVDAWRRVGPFAEARALTFFEAGTLIAFEWFAASRVDLAVIEVGLGGRLDATNVVRPELSLVTNVAFDHERHLGSDLASIAREKAGIFKPGVPAVIGEPDPGVAAVLVDRAREVGARVWRLGEEASISDVTVSRRGTSFTYRSRARGDALALRTPMAGAHQASNAALALLALEAAGVPLDPAAVERAVGHTRLAGRFELRGGGRGLRVLDIAHHREAVAALLSTARSVAPRRPWVAVVSILSDKPWADMLDMLRKDMDAIILTQAASAPVSRRWDPAELERRYGAAPDVRVEPDLDTALGAAAELSGDGTVFITGSAHTVGDARGHMEEYEEE